MKVAEKKYVIMMSACLTGAPLMVDGSVYPDQSVYEKLRKLPNAKIVTFCPEDRAIGTPRNMPDIHGGNGFDVIAGRAKVLDELGNNLTKKMVNAAKEMVQFAKDQDVDLAILMDISAMCGVQVISDGCRFDNPRKYQKGPGVATAMLRNAGIRVIAQRDYRSLEQLYSELIPGYQVDESKCDHHETEWYRGYFK